MEQRRAIEQRRAVEQRHGDEQHERCISSEKKNDGGAMNSVAAGQKPQGGGSGEVRIVFWSQ